MGEEVVSTKLPYRMEGRLQEKQSEAILDLMTVKRRGMANDGPTKGRGEPWPLQLFFKIFLFMLYENYFVFYILNYV